MEWTHKLKRQNKEPGRGSVNVYAELYKSGPPVEYAVLRETNTYAGQSPLKKSPDYTPLTRNPHENNTIKVKPCEEVMG